MHMRSVKSPQPSRTSEAHTARQGRVLHLLLAAAALAALPVGNVVAQQADQPSATPAHAPEVDEAAQAKKNKKDMICEYETSVGTRMKKKVCYTRAQMEARKRAGQNLMREVDRKPLNEDKSGT